MIIADSSGRVLEQWTGFQVAWTMARGYPGAFGEHVNALYVWIPLCLLFFVPFFDWRRPFALLHLDLLVLLSFSVSLAFFNHAHIYASVPLTYPPLLYLLARMLALLRRGRGSEGRSGNGRLASGRRRRPPGARTAAAPADSRPWLAIGIVSLLGFRIALNVTDANVIDVGYAGVIGASKVVHGDALYGALAGRQRTRRHLRPRQLRGVRPVRADLRLERHLGRPARRARRVGLLRPARGRAAVPDRPAHAWPDARHRARLRVGLLPLHAVRARERLQRHARRGDDPRGALLRRLAARARRVCGARGPDQVRAARARAAARDPRSARAATAGSASARCARAPSRCSCWPSSSRPRSSRSPRSRTIR